VAQLDGSELKMNVEEFLGRFALVYSATDTTQAELPAWVKETLKGIGRLIYAGKSSDAKTSKRHDVAAMTELFKKIDTSGDGTLQLENLWRALNSCLAWTLSK